ncbi:hypothetical protein MOF38_08135 [Bacillus haynesii]|uniref:hypothetical protein n=1 Tax=Bacillus haynesii TaxID=1925021 RepID=UPI0022831778|nr:hypothetical protein [Bacillus haynesii]MCY9399758.1 hypothetical protein [Bacillus haynesii]MEC0723109.1 hypothetical protein [Bacillus haynesii]
MNDILKKYVRFESKKVFAKDSPERPYQLRYKLTILDEGLKNYIADLQAEDINHTITWYEKKDRLKVKTFKPNWITKSPFIIFQCYGAFVKLHMLLDGKLNYPPGDDGDEYLFLNDQGEFVSTFRNEQSPDELETALTTFLNETLMDLISELRQHIKAAETAKAKGYDIVSEGGAPHD